MFNEKYKKEFSNITKSDLIQELEKVPGNPIINIIGENTFYMHVEEDMSTINLDDNSLEDEYQVSDKKTDLISPTMPDGTVHYQTVQDLIHVLDNSIPHAKILLNGKNHNIFINILSFTNKYLNISSYRSEIFGIDAEDYVYIPPVLTVDVLKSMLNDIENKERIVLINDSAIYHTKIKHFTRYSYLDLRNGLETNNFRKEE